MLKTDVLIIGAGFLGCSLARELSKYKLDIRVLEKGYDLGEGATKANSGVIYPGIHARAGSFKAKANIQGNKMFDDISKELDIPFKRIGSLYVSFHKDSFELFNKKYRNGYLNKAPGIRVIEKDEILEMEPNINKKAIKAIYNPSTGIISPFGMILAFAENANENKVEFDFDTEVISVEKYSNNYYLVNTSKEIYLAKYIVNVAGSFARELEGQVRNEDLVVKPKRGEYFITDKWTGNLINHVVFQAQDNDEGGTLLTPTISGNLLIGPTSKDINSYRKKETTKEGYDHLMRVAKKVLPSFDENTIIGSFAGIRTNIVNLPKEEKDFVVRVSSPRFISAVGIKNPGMTASPYLALEMKKLLIKEGLKLEERSDFNPYRKKQEPFLNLDKNIRDKKIKDNKDYGKVICRCEKITKGDIIDALNRPLAPKTLDGFKMRLRIGMGTCQGSFCTGKMVDIMSEVLNIKPEKVLKNLEGSQIVKGRLK